MLTLLIHLGYLSCDSKEQSVCIPNNEIQNEYVNAVSVSDWREVSKALKHSADLLYAIWKENEQAFAEGMERAHFETSHLQYNDENNITHFKPDPEVFVKAAEFLGLPAEKCMVVKDAEAGINAAIAGHMDSGAIGDATGCGKATYNLTSFLDLWKSIRNDPIDPCLGLETSYESGWFLFCVKSRETMIKRERFVW